MHKRYPITLTETGRDYLHALIAAGTAPARKLAHARLLLAAPGRPARVDYEYERGGVVNLFPFCAPPEGQRWVDLTERRPKADWAHQIRDLVDARYPDAERLVLVLDNLNTHTPAALYEASPPAEAKRLADKLARHYTPRHGSWLTSAARIVAPARRPLASA